jgi:hypothetical protein
MAEGILRHDAGEHFDVESAGTKASSVRSEAIAVMSELGIDISEDTIQRALMNSRASGSITLLPCATTPGKPARSSSVLRKNFTMVLTIRPDLLSPPTTNA